MTAEAAQPPLLADPQDPLPESNWLWRRLLAFAIVTFVGWQVHLTGNRIARFGEKNPVEAIDALVNLSHWREITLWIVLLLYMIAPSAEQVAKIAATLSAWKGGISTSVASRVATAAGIAETKTVTGPAVAQKADEPGIPDYAKP